MCWRRCAPRGWPACRPRRSRAAIEKFQAVEHRLEYVATINGVEYYNDSKATNVDATAKAVAAFPGGIHLILGGKDKGSDYTTLAPLLRERVRAVYTIGAAAAKIESQLRGVVPIHSCETLANAVSAAAAAARPGEWCCWRRPAPASISLRTTSSAAASSRNWWRNSEIGK